MNLIPKLSSFFAEAGRIVGALVVIVPIGIGAWHWTAAAADQRAQAYIQRVVDQRFSDLAKSVEELNLAINKLVSGQKVESTQSQEEARINRQILCLQQLELDPSSGSVEACEQLR